MICSRLNFTDGNIKSTEYRNYVTNVMEGILRRHNRVNAIQCPHFGQTMHVDVFNTIDCVFVKLRKDAISRRSHLNHLVVRGNIKLSRLLKEFVSKCYSVENTVKNSSEKLFSMRDETIYIFNVVQDGGLQFDAR